MSLLGKIGTSTLLGLGMLLLVSGIYASQNRQISSVERSNQTWACLLFGVPMIVLGGRLNWESQQHLRRQEQEKLRSVFFRLLTQSSRLTPLQLAMAANISGTAAKRFLDEQARDFSATLDADEHGDIYYCFNVGQLQPPAVTNFDPDRSSTASNALLSPGQTNPVQSSLDQSDSQLAVDFDIMLIACPARSKIAALKCTRFFTGLGLKGAKDLVERVPTTLKRGVNAAEAAAIQRSFEEIGAVIQVIPRKTDLSH